jgi:hypothetical protein
MLLSLVVRRVAPLAMIAALAGCERSAPPTCAPEAPAVAAAAVAPEPAAAPAAAAPAIAVAPVAPAPVVAAPAPIAKSATSLRVKRVVLAEGVADREPVGATSAFHEGATDKVYAFVELENPERLPGEVFVSFQPPEGGAEIGNVRLAVGASPRWRTWAFSRAVKRSGEWTAVVRDAEGRVLAREPFAVML